MSQLQNSSPRKIALLTTLALAAARLRVQVCPRRRQPNPLADSGKSSSKTSIFRMRRVLQLALMKIGILALSCVVLHTAAMADDTPTALVSCQNTFAHSFYEQISSEQNVVFSPYSIFTALTMLHAGAKTETAQEIGKVLGLDKIEGDAGSLTPKLAAMLLPKPGDEQSYTFTIANAIWVDLDTQILPDYRAQMEEVYKAKIESLDFGKTNQAIETINEWTANQTGGKITKLLQDGDADVNTRMLLTNALYFQGTWTLPFDKKVTRNRMFYIKSAMGTPVPMMQQATFFPYTETADFQILSLPIKGQNESGSRFAGLILLPKEYKPLAELKDKLTPQLFNDAIESLNSRFVDLAVPKFCLKQRLNLNQILAKMGMHLPFSPKADFSGIDGTKDLFLTSAIHESLFIFNESGISAAAATAAAIGAKSVGPQPNRVSFQADHPFFFFLIDENTKDILFFGKIEDPSKAVEPVAKLSACEKSMILTNSCQNPQAGSAGGGGDILEHVDEPPPGQGASKGRFCAAESFATGSVCE